jgi:hypothetical protein
VSSDEENVGTLLLIATYGDPEYAGTDDILTPPEPLTEPPELPPEPPEPPPEGASVTPSPEEVVPSGDCTSEPPWEALSLSDTESVITEDISVVVEESVGTESPPPKAIAITRIKAITEPIIHFFLSFKLIPPIYFESYLFM